MSSLATGLSAFGGAAQGVGNLLEGISSLLPTNTTTKFSGQSNKATSQVMLDDKAVERLLNIIMQSTEGLQATASGERTAGIFNSTTNEQLINDLMVRAAGQVAVASAPTVQTQDIGPTTTKQKSSKCFITTAICEHMGKPDNCLELFTLRYFRDNWMLKLGMEELIKEYYETAPKIVDAINAEPAVAELAWGVMYHKYIMPAYLAVWTGHYFRAYRLYTDMFLFAKKLARV